MPVEGPDNSIVGPLQGTYGLLLRVEVKVDGALGTAAGKERLVHGMPGHRVHFLLVRPVCLELAQGPHIE